MARRKNGEQTREDEQTVYKPAKKAKQIVKEAPERELTGREKKEKARAAAVAKDRRRAVSRAGDGCVACQFEGY